MLTHTLTLQPPTRRVCAAPRSHHCNLVSLLQAVELFGRKEWSECLIYYWRMKTQIRTQAIIRVVEDRLQSSFPDLGPGQRGWYASGSVKILTQDGQRLDSSKVTLPCLEGGPVLALRRGKKPAERVCPSDRSAWFVSKHTMCQTRNGGAIPPHLGT